jgi:hypothetical protein
MTALIVTVVSFVVALLGVIHSHAAKEGQIRIIGLSRLGVVLLLLSTVGVVAGIVGQVSDSKDAREQRELLRGVYAELKGIQGKPIDPAFAERLSAITNRISAVASQSRGSDFSLSGFSESDFQRGNFSRANFDGALFADAAFRHAIFAGADLRDADLSRALINSNTRLPAERR